MAGFGIARCHRHNYYVGVRVRRGNAILDTTLIMEIV
jgi:hypothetical protein